MSLKDRRSSAGPGRINVLYLQPSIHFGGAERQASILSARFAEHGVDVLPLVGPGRVVADLLEAEGIQEILQSAAFPGAWAEPGASSGLRLPGRYYRAVKEVSALVDALIPARGIDLVFAAMPFSWIAASRPALRHGVPVVWRAGGTLLPPFLGWPLHGWSLRYPPALLLCCSEAVREVFGPLVAAPAEVVDNGVDLAQFRPRAVPPTFKRPQARLVVGYAARFAPEKRPEDFIEMAARLAAAHPEVDFLMAGDGPRRRACQALIAARGLQERVKILGYIPDVRGFYASCDVLTLPSRSEGLPNMVLESMAMQKALVVSDRAVRTGVVRDRREGLIYPVGDVAAFSACVDQLLSAETLRAQLAHGALERVRRDFDADRSARRIAGLLRLLVHRHRRELPRLTGSQRVPV